MNSAWRFLLFRVWHQCPCRLHLHSACGRRYHWELIWALAPVLKCLHRSLWTIWVNDHYQHQNHALIKIAGNCFLWSTSYAGALVYDECNEKKKKEARHTRTPWWSLITSGWAYARQITWSLLWASSIHATLQICRCNVLHW
jgi:hypothetical protein